MLFEIFQDMLPLLFTMSILFTIAGLKIAEYITVSDFLKHRMLTRQRVQIVKAKLQVNTTVLSVVNRRQTWITCMTKRKEAPEDDGDFHPFLFKSELKQGGSQWKNHLYSHTLKHTDC
ncbi:hypothetical protein LGQ02_20525 [Bacillus shivajii]|uniref:hypothetical protein n=1 Tax=Bacillus shivajii TaxID=1983719 RepID=UPI001CFA4DFE|nr:hypothetical protein [Bacillus shivajii]UCZ53129.1 hypothetical protein LGQ02_20525 [Bacillus shivajii]